MRSCCEEIELQDTAKKYELRRWSSPLLCGKSIGAQVNRILSENSLSMLIVWGNIKIQTNMDATLDAHNVACFISTNQIHKNHVDLTDAYRIKYERWMDRAVSDLICQIDSIPFPCILFPNSDDCEKLFFDLTLKGYEVIKKTRIFINATLKNEFDDVCIFELFIDTVVYDNGIW